MNESLKIPTRIVSVFLKKKVLDSKLTLDSSRRRNCAMLHLRHNDIIQSTSIHVRLRRFHQHTASHSSGLITSMMQAETSIISHTLINSRALQAIFRSKSMDSLFQALLDHSMSLPLHNCTTPGRTMQRTFHGRKFK